MEPLALLERCLHPEIGVRLQEVGAGTAIVFSDSAFCVHQ
jgi:hypothetical protein